MSIKRAINDRIPHEWNYVLRKNKVLTKFVNDLYGILPDRYKNRYRTKSAISWINSRLKGRFTQCIPILIKYEQFVILKGKEFEELRFWQKIEREIEIYKEQCR